MPEWCREPCRDSAATPLRAVTLACKVDRARDKADLWMAGRDYRASGSDRPSRGTQECCIAAVLSQRRAVEPPINSEREVRAAPRKSPISAHSECALQASPLGPTLRGDHGRKTAPPLATISDTHRRRALRPPPLRSDRGVQGLVQLGSRLDRGLQNHRIPPAYRRGSLIGAPPLRSPKCYPRSLGVQWAHVSKHWSKGNGTMASN